MTEEADEWFDSAAELSCDAWFSDPRLRAAVSATGRLALARGGELAVFASRAGRPESRVACLWPIDDWERPPSEAELEVTAIAWASDDGAGRSDRELLVSGTAEGAVYVHEPHVTDGTAAAPPLLLAFRFHCAPVLQLRPRAAAGVGAEHATALWVLYRGGIVVAVHQLDGVAGRYWRAGSGGDDGEAAARPYSKYELEGMGDVLDVAPFARRGRAAASDGASRLELHAPPAECDRRETLLCAGREPCLAVFGTDWIRPQLSALQYAGLVGQGVGTAVAGLVGAAAGGVLANFGFGGARAVSEGVRARHERALERVGDARTERVAVTAGPGTAAGVRAGVAAARLAKRKLKAGAMDLAAGVASAADAAADQWVTGEGGAADAADGPRPYRRIFWTTREYQGAAAAMTLRHGGRAFRDASSRVVTALSVEPSGQLMAAADTLGRVTLVDTRVAPMLIIRLWKGLREAGVGWLTSPLVAASEPAPAMSADADALPAGLCLVLYSAVRGFAQVWRVPHGECLKTVSVGLGAYLLTTPPPTPAPARADDSASEQPISASRCTRCFVLLSASAGATTPPSACFEIALTRHDLPDAGISSAQVELSGL